MHTDRICTRQYKTVQDSTRQYKTVQDSTSQEDFRKTSGRLQDDLRNIISSKAYMKIPELACSFMSMHAVS